MNALELYIHIHICHDMVVVKGEGAIQSGPCNAHANWTHNSLQVDLSILYCTRCCTQNRWKDTKLQRKLTSILLTVVAVAQRICKLITCKYGIYHTIGVHHVGF